MTDSEIGVLVVDDDDITFELVERALRRIEGNFRIVPAADGMVALDVLRGRNGHKMGRPYLILLDLNMPRMNGFEFLEAVRADESLATSVIFVLTTSDADADRTRAYRDHVAGYMVKSSVGPQFARVAKLIAEYRTAVHLPH